LSKCGAYIATVFLGLMMLLTVADVFMRFFFNAPITGTTEITQLMMVIVVFLSLPWGGVTGSHVKVDLIVARFGRKTRAIFDLVTLLLSLFIFAIIAWRSLIESMQIETTTSLIGVPLAPFYYILTLGFALLTLVVATLVIEACRKVFGK
jgi:TRAP-type C4-dicarboxylate transport system permease small subunit